MAVRRRVVSLLFVLFRGVVETSPPRLLGPQDNIVFRWVADAHHKVLSFTLCCQDLYFWGKSRTSPEHSLYYFKVFVFILIDITLPDASYSVRCKFWLRWFILTVSYTLVACSSRPGGEARWSIEKLHVILSCFLLMLLLLLFSGVGKCTTPAVKTCTHLPWMHMTARNYLCMCVYVCVCKYLQAGWFGRPRVSLCMWCVLLRWGAAQPRTPAMGAETRPTERSTSPLTHHPLPSAPLHSPFPSHIFFHIPERLPYTPSPFLGSSRFLTHSHPSQNTYKGALIP